jgi:hypothetical protein
MSRDYWTIYDDDSRDFEQELVHEETIDVDFDLTLQVVLRRMMIKEGKFDHFENEKDLFEV